MSSSLLTLLIVLLHSHLLFEFLVFQRTVAIGSTYDFLGYDSLNVHFVQVVPCLTFLNEKLTWNSSCLRLIHINSRLLGEVECTLMNIVEAIRMQVIVLLRVDLQVINLPHNMKNRIGHDSSIVLHSQVILNMVFKLRDHTRKSSYDDFIPTLGLNSLVDKNNPIFDNKFRNFKISPISFVDSAPVARIMDKFKFKDKVHARNIPLTLSNDI